jgi:hypothetical protein
MSVFPGKEEDVGETSLSYRIQCDPAQEVGISGERSSGSPNLVAGVHAKVAWNK